MLRPYRALGLVGIHIKSLAIDLRRWFATYPMLQHANTRSNSSALVAGARAFATVAVTAAITSRYSRWFDMQAGVAKYSKDFTKRPVKGLLGIQT